MNPSTSKSKHTLCAPLSQRPNGDEIHDRQVAGGHHSSRTDCQDQTDYQDSADHFGDSSPSGGIRPDVTPSPIADDWQPIRTYNGIKWVPTIPYQRTRTCPTCPVYAECSIDVARGDFAWCEDIIPADYELTNDTHTAYSTPQRPT